MVHEVQVFCTSTILSIFIIPRVKRKPDYSVLTANCSFKALFAYKVHNLYVLFILSGVTPSPLLHVRRQDGELTLSESLRRDERKGKKEAAFLCSKSKSSKILVERRTLQIDRSPDLSPFLAPMQYRFLL